MKICQLENASASRDLVAVAQDVDEPVIVYDGEDECLVAMRPAVFERVLFDTNLLNKENRHSLHL